VYNTYLEWTLSSSFKIGNVTTRWSHHGGVPFLASLDQISCIWLLVPFLNLDPHNFKAPFCLHAETCLVPSSQALSSRRGETQCPARVSSEMARACRILKRSAGEIRHLPASKPLYHHPTHCRNPAAPFPPIWALYLDEELHRRACKRRIYLGSSWMAAASRVFIFSKLIDSFFSDGGGEFFKPN
jgi:hypothetical protein